jgi:uncharacterized protein
MVSVTAEERVRVATLCASWLTITFVHWPVPAERIQPLLPAGLTADEYGGTAWVGLTPFRMADMRPGGVPGARRIGTALSSVTASSLLQRRPDPFSTLETNLRTYVREPDGRDGLWFFTLEVGNPLLAVALRWLIGAPYHGAQLRLDRTAGQATYAGSRRNGPQYDMVVRPQHVTAPNEQEVWFTGRWRAYTSHLGQLLATPVQHEPWPLQAARLERLDQTVTDRMGLDGLEAEPLVHFSEGVRDVRVGVPRVVRAGDR